MHMWILTVVEVRTEVDRETGPAQKNAFSPVPVSRSGIKYFRESTECSSWYRDAREETVETNRPWSN